MKKQASKIEPYKNAKLNVEKRVEDLLSRMTLEEKVAQVSGESNMETRSNARLGIPSLKVADGPHGMRWENAACFPTAVTLASSWDTNLMKQVGVALAEETRGKGRHVILGPCINIHRTPQGGRNFESFGEDPYLAGRMAVAYVRGVQSQKIGTSTKHFACNNQEKERFVIDAKVGERALREIYLPGFKAAVQEADTWTVMAAYNRVNGPYCCANQHLLNDILKNEWGFRGVVVSDWGACHGTVDSAHGGLDLEMPGPGRYFSEELLKAVRNGEVGEAILDDKVRRNLRVLFLVGLFDGVERKFKGSVDSKPHRKLARESAAQSIVLLKNRRKVLPLDIRKIKTLAVLGPNASVMRLGGGGSSSVLPYYSVSPLEGIRKKCGSKVAVHFSEGCVMPGDLMPVDSAHLVPPEGHGAEHGLWGEYFDNMNLEGRPVLTRIDEKVDFNWGEGSPAAQVPCDHFSARWTGRLVPSKSGKYQLGMTSDDGFRLFLDGKMIIDRWIDQAGVTTTAEVDLVAGKSYDLRAEYFENVGGALARLGWVTPHDILDAGIRTAAKADAAVIFAGSMWQFEGEGTDRENIDLPGLQNELIRAVAKVNPNTIVVLVNGTPLAMDPWIDQVSAVVEAWYPGQEGGNAIADVLFGDVNPSGKLTVSFPKSLNDVPCAGNYPGKDGVVRYEEGIFVGYRHYDTRGVEPLFPFGHGLSYTRFAYGRMGVKHSRSVAGTKVDVTVEIKNAGKCKGAEVVQLYVRDLESSVERPVKELKGFKKVALKPGGKKLLRFSLDESAFSFYDPEKKGWVTEPGVFEIMLGSSSRDIRLKKRIKL